MIEVKEGAVSEYDLGAAVPSAHEVAVHEHRADVATISNAFVNDRDDAFDKREIARGAARAAAKGSPERRLEPKPGSRREQQR